MVRTPVTITIVLAVMIIGGLALAAVGSDLGSIVAVAGILAAGAFLVAVFLRAWAGDQKRAWGPGSLWRDYRAELAAKEKDSASTHN